MNDQEAAKQFVDDLFRNGAGEEADRLLLIQDGAFMAPDIAKPRDLGGWCKAAVLDRVNALLAQARADQAARDAEICNEIEEASMNHLGLVGDIAFWNGRVKAAREQTSRLQSVPAGLSDRGLTIRLSREKTMCEWRWE